MKRAKLVVRWAVALAPMAAGIGCIIKANLSLPVFRVFDLFVTLGTISICTSLLMITIMTCTSRIQRTLAKRG